MRNVKNTLIHRGVHQNCPNRFGVGLAPGLTTLTRIECPM